MAAIQNPEVAPGETWAYRATRADPLVQVEVLKLGLKRPKRVFVRFVDDEFEGRQDWVPPARLKAPWGDIDEFIAGERRWNAVVSQSPARDSAEEMAASIIFDNLIDRGLATLGNNATEGVVTINDVEGLATYLDVDPEGLRADPLCFEEDGLLVAPWSIAILVARRAAELHPDAILRHVEGEEADARNEAAFGKDYPGYGKHGPWHVSAESCAEDDEKVWRPVRDILRQWSGQEALDRRSEVYALRAEAIRLAKLTESAVEALRQAGASRDANRIARELRPPPDQGTVAEPRGTSAR